MNIKNNLFLNILNQILLIIVPLILTPYLSRSLGAEQLGVYAYSYNISYYFSLFIMLGLNNYGNRCVARIKNNQIALCKTAFSIYGIQLFMGLIVLLFYVLFIYTSSKQLVLGKIMTIVLIATMMDISWFYNGMEMFSLMVKRNLIIKFLNIILIFLFVKTSKDLNIYSFIMCSSLFIGNLFLLLCAKDCIFRHKVKLRDILLHFKPNLVLFLPVIAISIYNIMDKIILGYLSDYIEVGFYDSSEKIMNLPKSAITALGIVMLPRITSLIVDNNMSVMKKYIQRSIIFSFAISSVCALGIMSVADEFVPLYYGEGFEKCVVLYKILLPCTVFEAIASVLRTQYLLPYNLDKQYVISVFAGAIINLVLDFTLIPKYGSIGASIGTLFAEIAVFAYQFHVVRKQMPITRPFIEGVVFFVFGIFMYMILQNISLLYNSTLFTFFAKIFIGTLIYGVLALLYYRFYLKEKIIEHI